MSSVGERIWAIVLLVGVVMAALLFFVGQGRISLVMGLSPISIAIIAASLISTLSAVFAWWYVPLGRRPERIPMWNDRFHRPRLRAVKATSTALALGVLVTGGVLTCILGLLPARDGGSPGLLPGGVIVRSDSGGGKRCSGTLTLDGRDGHTSLCACPLGRCVTGFSPGVGVGQHVDLEIRENWAGKILVGLVPMASNISLQADRER
jgi:hypothetical protein